ncbi:MAG: biosynthetic-type acetolactate synthase large subunit, partial [Abditibacteriales bacterium]|nr:biosynthetic-type acetolactate synthase large subunit [Abditibacteriales bacterium]MDW8367234.1 biosynthetic-type acetolactate synthase large subunit [Abditibacteriales bacterium]
MKGAEALVEALKREGVCVIFGISGGAALPIYDALASERAKDIWNILTRHEQGAAHMAEGFAKVSGRVGVCLATSGPGATNLVTGITDAMMDSVPIVALTGQVPTFMIGTDAFQEADIVGITMPIVKHSYLVKNAFDLPRIVKEAFYIARTGRPGPVLIDIPRDVSQAEIGDYVEPPGIHLRGYNPHYTPDLSEIDKAVRLIEEARKPVIYAGGGIIHAEASAELRALAEKIHAPVTTTLMGKGAFPDRHPLFIGPPGMHGTATANWALHYTDLIIAVGVRFDDRVTGKLSEFAPEAQVIHIEIDPAEIHKNRFADAAILADAKTALRELLQRVPEKQHTAWLEQIEQWKREQPLRYKQNGKLKPQYILEQLADITGGDVIMSTDVGQHQMWAMQYFPIDRPRRWLTSGGLGTMGFGFPAAIGAKVACMTVLNEPDAEVWCVSGDGSFQMNLQEL